MDQLENRGGNLARGARLTRLRAKKKGISGRLEVQGRTRRRSQPMTRT